MTPIKLECKYTKETAHTYAYDQVDGELLGRIYIRKYALNDNPPKTVSVIIQ